MLYKGFWFMLKITNDNGDRSLGVRSIMASAMLSAIRIDHAHSYHR